MKAEKEGFVETINGRRRYIKAINSANKSEKAAAERNAINTPIQGSAADMSKLAMILVGNDERLKELGFRLLIPVHDELIAECPKENAKKCSKRQ